MPSFDLSDIMRAIPGAVLARAQRYVHQGRVRGIEPGDRAGTLVGKVQGTERRPYEQHIRIVGDGRPTRIIGRCSCPVGTNCKHVAAVLLAALDQPEPVSNGHDKNTALIDPNLARWLADLAAAAAPAPTNDYPSEVRQRLIYVLDTEGGLWVELGDAGMKAATYRGG